MVKILNCFTILLLVSLIGQGYTHKIRWCVTNQAEANKCNDINAAAKKHNLNIEFECSKDFLDTCISNAKDGDVDVVIVDGHHYGTAKTNDLIPVLYEGFGNDNVIIAIADPDMTKEDMENSAVDYDESDLREAHAAMFLNYKRGSKVCGGLKAGTKSPIKIIKSSDIKQYKDSNKKLICPSLERKDLDQYKNCNIEANLVNAVFVPKTHKNKAEIISAFKSIVEHFGPTGAHNSDFKIFGKYKDDLDYNNENVIFSDDAVNLLDEPELPNGVNQDVFNQIHCHGTMGHHHHHGH